MTEAEAGVLQALWDHIHDNELAGHFPHELLQGVDRVIHPVRCTECGGRNIQVAMWVRLNENKVMDDFGSWDETDTKWCSDCDKHVLLESGGVCDIRLVNWHNNELQFARLLWELYGTLENKTNLYEVAESMDLELEQVRELFKRAEEVFESAKEPT